jgi:hypothetical protein
LSHNRTLLLFYKWFEFIKTIINEVSEALKEEKKRVKSLVKSDENFDTFEYSSVDSHLLPKKAVLKL